MFFYSVDNERSGVPAAFGNAVICRYPPEVPLILDEGMGSDREG